jgi:hypothetical protein
VEGVTADGVVLIATGSDVALAANVETAATEAATLAFIADPVVLVLALSTLDVYPLVPPHPYDVVEIITAIANLVARNWFDERVIAHSLIE